MVAGLLHCVKADSASTRDPEIPTWDVPPITPITIVPLLASTK
jgi:hypothetical protein